MRLTLQHQLDLMLLEQGLAAHGGELILVQGVIQVLRDLDYLPIPVQHGPISFELDDEEIVRDKLNQFHILAMLCPNHIDSPTSRVRFEYEA